MIRREKKGAVGWEEGVGGRKEEEEGREGDSRTSISFLNLAGYLRSLRPKTERELTCSFDDQVDELGSTRRCLKKRGRPLGGKLKQTTRD